MDKENTKRIDQETEITVSQDSSIFGSKWQDSHLHLDTNDKNEKIKILEEELSKLKRQYKETLSNYSRLLNDFGDLANSYTKTQETIYYMSVMPNEKIEAKTDLIQEQAKEI